MSKHSEIISERYPKAYDKFVTWYATRENPDIDRELPLVDFEKLPYEYQRSIFLDFVYHANYSGMPDISVAMSFSKHGKQIVSGAIILAFQRIEDRENGVKSGFKID